MEINDVIDKYLDRGFGSMNKNDFEVWIFYYLLQNRLKGKSDNAISRELKIPKSRVTRLRYEAELKNPHSEDFYKESFYQILETRVYKTVSENRIQFSITDKALRLYLDDILERQGSYADSSFNTDIVTITAADLLILIANFEKKDDLIKKVIESRKNHKADLSEDTKNQILEGASAILKDIGEHFAPNVTELITNYIQQYKDNHGTIS